MVSFKDSITRKRWMGIILLIVYGAVLIKILVFKDLPVIRVGSMMFNFGGTHEGPANWVPFKTILPYLIGRNGILIGGLNIIGNIILLVPIGILLPLVYRNMKWKTCLVLAAAIGFLIEGLQVILRVGIFDIDDVILNALGVILGYWTFTLVSKWVNAKKYKNIVIAAVIVMLAAMAVVYVVYPKADQPVNPGRDVHSGTPAAADKGEKEPAQGVDPCNGTGGIGEITSIEVNTIMIKRKDGKIQLVNLSPQVKIQTSAGTGSIADLKIGKMVTLIGDANPDGSFTANSIVLCNSGN